LDERRAPNSYSTFNYIPVAVVETAATLGRKLNARELQDLETAGPTLKIEGGALFASLLIWDVGTS
jgi:hypothetical protein